jgi:hypothetical protein
MLKINVCDSWYAFVVSINICTLIEPYKNVINLAYSTLASTGDHIGNKNKIKCKLKKRMNWQSPALIC